VVVEGCHVSATLDDVLVTCNAIGGAYWADSGHANSSPIRSFLMVFPSVLYTSNIISAFLSLHT